MISIRFVNCCRKNFQNFEKFYPKRISLLPFPNGSFQSLFSFAHLAFEVKEIFILKDVVEIIQLGGFLTNFKRVALTNLNTFG